MKLFLFFPRKSALTFNVKGLLTIKCQSLFSEENKNSIINLSPAEFVKRVVRPAVSEYKTNLCMLGNFACVLSSVEFFLSNFFKKSRG